MLDRRTMKFLAYLLVLLAVFGSSYGEDKMVDKIKAVGNLMMDAIFDKYDKEAFTNGWMHMIKGMGKDKAFSEEYYPFGFYFLCSKNVTQLLKILLL